ncbi:Zn2/Cys6 DNA-binding protein [Coniochaeta hoffmannii]|uniref:Zn2/Cys6 DNA-binding protein n=1 Tax=Coniochaeta hoffmannii TaxID=91930 RepID=A0AA38RX07_9PEZI|nr:Zn2/Cys6 DNA-binding protein [Coniochaeta hoffmannii]
MDIGFSAGPRPGGPNRSTNGCWTCRLRRKKCDEKQPVCDTCATLLITCHNGQEKPDWMDGGARQDAMAEQLKREVKLKAHLRLRQWERQIPGDAGSADSRNGGQDIGPEPPGLASQQKADCTQLPDDSRGGIPFGRSDTVLLMFYLENVLPFLFPFYRPSPLEGGKSWILELMFSSPVVRQATLAQTSYFFSVARRSVSCGVIWDTMLAQTKEVFDTLRQSLDVINASNVAEHLHGAVRILASIMQVQRFEVAVLSLDNCRAHLTAALALFGQLLSSSGSENGAAAAQTEARTLFNSVVDRLGPPTWVLPDGCARFPTAEQAAFRFSSALLIFDDIIASTALQQRPTLYEYHDSLLGGTEDAKPVVDLEAVVGCHNCVLRLVGEVAVLDAWKQQSRRAGTLDVMELVRRATVIKDALDEYLDLLARRPAAAGAHEDDSDLLDIFKTDYWQQQQARPTQSASQTTATAVTRVWIHAASLYLSVVVSGWQPAGAEVRHHVARVLELVAGGGGGEISPPAMLRTVVWPFCVAGCLAEAAQEPVFRGLVAGLRPLSVFGTLRKALDVMENVWRARGTPGDSVMRDLAVCFRSEGDLVLLV